MSELTYCVPYPYEGGNSWNLRNDNVILRKESDNELLEIYDQMDEIAAKSKTPRVNFIGRYTGVMSNTAGIAALQAVNTEYLYPLNYGMVEDVEAGLEKWKKEAEKVGLKEIQDEFAQLWTAYCEEMGY